MDGAQFFQGYTKQLRGDSLLYITTFLKSPGTHLIEPGGWKAELILEPASGFEHGTLDWECACSINVLTVSICTLKPS